MAVIKKHITNTSGTSMPTFKFRSGGGIELISSTVRGDNGEALNKFKVKTGENSIHEVAYYDTHIASEDIGKIKYVKENGKSTLLIILRDGTSFELPTTVDSSTIVLPSEAQDKELAMYGRDEDGNVSLQTTGVKITTSADDIRAGKNNTIPTSGAINTLMQETFDPLEKRSDGYEVKSVPVDGE